MNDGVTEKVNVHQLLDSGLNTKFCELANPLTLRTRYEDDENFGK